MTTPKRLHLNFALRCSLFVSIEQAKKQLTRI